MPSLKLPTAPFARWVKGTRALLPFTSPISSTRGRDRVLDNLLIFTPHLKGLNIDKAHPKPPLASLLQLHYPLSNPETGLLSEYSLGSTTINSGSGASSNERQGTQNGDCVNGAVSAVNRAGGRASAVAASGDGEASGWVRYNEDLLIEDMDMFAADVACLHVGGLDDKRLVTAHLERLEILRHHHPVSRCLSLSQPAGGLGQGVLRTEVDLELSGQVVWVGRSSMEVLLELSTAGQKQLAEGQGADEPGPLHTDCITEGQADKRQLIGRAQFIMATRTTDLAKAMPIQPLQLTNAHEELLSGEVQARIERKKLEAQQQRQAQQASPQEAALPSDAPLTEQQARACSSAETSSSGRTAFPMACTRCCEPVRTRYEDRNTTGTVFGGQLLVYGTSISSDVAEAHAGGPCNLLQMYDVAFISLAPLDCELLLEGHVAYAEGPLMHVRAAVRRVQESESNGSEPVPGALVTTFWCTYTTANGASVAPVAPQNQSEYHDWQHARECVPVRQECVAQL